MRQHCQTQPENAQTGKASQSFGLLRAQGGFSLIEVLVISVVLVLLITTIYMGAIYAEKQTRQNYRHRVATLIASGEIEKQFVQKNKLGTFSSFSGNQVLIDVTEVGNLYGSVSVRNGREIEYYVTKQYPLSYVVAEVTWIDPETKKRHSVKLREDFYDVEEG
ncbi:hypothetical protein MASR1M36_01680 [Candidatus Cloacimonadaceae bacterium]|jgi:Tfp pilus assembly protein PilE